jgi:hypothetical protein
MAATATIMFAQPARLPIQGRGARLSETGSQNQLNRVWALEMDGDRGRPLEKAAEAYARMLSGKAQSRAGHVALPSSMQFNVARRGKDNSLRLKLGQHAVDKMNGNRAFAHR